RAGVARLPKRTGWSNPLAKAGWCRWQRPSSMSWSPEPAPTGDWAADLTVGETGRAGPQWIALHLIGARGRWPLGHPDPLSEAGVVLPAFSSATSGKRSASPLSRWM